MYTSKTSVMVRHSRQPYGKEIPVGSMRSPVWHRKLKIKSTNFVML
jgi:hypothetical protein